MPRSRPCRPCCTELKVRRGDVMHLPFSLSQWPKLRHVPPSGREVTPAEILKLRQKCRQRVVEAGSLADSHRSLKLYAQLMWHIDSNWFRTWAFCHGYRTCPCRPHARTQFQTWAFCHGYRTSPSTNNYHLLFRTWIFLPWVSN